jgi:hypothetical protein
VPDKSESAEKSALTWTVPRWVFEVWLWVNVPASLFAWYVCDPSASGNWCSPASPIFEFVFRLFPMTLQMAFPAAAPNELVVCVLLLLTAVVHLAVRRFLPSRLGLWRFAAIWLGWWLLSVAAFMLSLLALWGWHELGV